MKVKCRNCNSTNIEFAFFNGDKSLRISINKKVILAKANKAIKIADSEDGDYIAECHGNCDDETCVILEDKNKIKFTDPYDILKVVAGISLDVDIKSILKSNNVKELKKSISDGLNVNSCLMDLGYEEDAHHEWSILIFAIQNEAYDVVIELLNAGADTNTPISWTGSTPLMCVVGNKRRNKKQFDVVKTLIDKGADINKKDVYGETVFDIADLWSKKQLKEYIINYTK